MELERNVWPVHGFVAVLRALHCGITQDEEVAMDVSTVQMVGANALDKVSKTAFGMVVHNNDAAPSASGGDFASMIQQSLAQVNNSQATAESLSHQFQLGQNDVSVEDAMISMQKANISFQTTVQVRNKLVAAYNDVMNMQV